MAERRPSPWSAWLLALAVAAASLAAAGPAPAQDAVAKVDRRALYGDGAPVLGNPRGDVTIVAFLDYRCPWCRALHPDLMRVVREDGRIRLIVKDWPILSPESVVAARAALAARYQGRHAAAHDALMRSGGRLDQATIDAALASAGVDPARLAADMAAHGAEIDRVLARNAALAERIGLSGTPALVIGPYLIPGGVSAGDLAKAVAAAREKRG
jgi:protein-disulfide isomerase